MTRLWPEEAERAVLSAILGAACVDVAAGHRIVRRVRATGLTPAHFYLASLGELYRVVDGMAAASIPVDPISVAAELDRDHADPHVIGRLHVLAHEVAPFSACERYALIVIEAAIRREIEERAAS